MFSYKHTRNNERGDGMVNLDFKQKKNGVPVLSKDEIDNLGEIVINDYNPKMLKEASALDVEEFLELYAELEIDYKDLTHNQSILGMTVFNDCNIPVYDAKNNKAKRIPVNEGTVLIDNSLLDEDQLRRGRFTITHEISHWLIHRQVYLVDKNQLSLFDFMENQKQPVVKCRTSDIESTKRKKLVTDDDWMEWQADSMASALLMPKSIFVKITRDKFISVGMEKCYYELGSDFEKDLWADLLPYELADIFDVSVTAAKIRLKNLGFIREEQGNHQYFLV